MNKNLDHSGPCINGEPTLGLLPGYECDKCEAKRKNLAPAHHFDESEKTYQAFLNGMDYPNMLSHTGNYINKGPVSVEDTINGADRRGHYGC